MSQLSLVYLQKLRTDIHAYALKRRDIIKQSDDALHHAKRSIFAMHRGNMTEAKEKLVMVEAMLKGLFVTYKKEPRFTDEGAFKAALEEYVEAVLFYQFITTGSIGPVKKLPIEAESYLSGLCDVPGELYRYAIKAATAGDSSVVQQCADMANEIIGELIEFNLTSYLRTKFDQAKQAAHKLEQVVYEVAIRGRKV